MKQTSKAAILVFALLLVLSCAQRGGGFSSGSSGAKFRLFKDRSWKNIFIQISVFIALVVCGVFYSIKADERRKKKIDSVMKKYEAKMQEFSATLSPEEKDNLINQFLSKSYTMVIEVKNNSQKIFCKIEVIDFEKENENKYSIKMSGSDEVGRSELQGLLMFTDNGIGLKLSKVYRNRDKAGQTFMFDILLYEGAGTPQRLSGEWAFQGWEDYKRYSGSWIMKEL